MMCATSSSSAAAGSFELRSERLGSMPIVNHFLREIGMERLLARHLPAPDPRLRLDPVTAIGVVVRNLVLHREPLYALGEWAAAYEPSQLGLTAADQDVFNDDRIGRALRRLFAADRATMTTELVLSVVERFGLDLSQLHNDSTTVTFSGAYAQASGRSPAGKRSVAITHGHNKDHRPDLKQLLWILTVTSDGAVPICHRVADGNTADDNTHVATWNTLCKLVGSPDFLYVADCKLCNRRSMRHIDAHGGRFLTVLPRSRKEDATLRRLMHDRPLPMVEVQRRPARRQTDPDDVWEAAESTIPSAEGYRIVLVRSSAKQARDANARIDKINTAYADLDKLKSRLAGPKCRIRTIEAAQCEADQAVAGAHRWVDVTVTQHRQDPYAQDGPGRPGANTRYKRNSRPRFDVSWKSNNEAIKLDAASDGCFPLITNDPKASAADLLKSYKYQPNLERRHAQLKGPQLVAPVFLKDEARIEGLMCCHFVALLVQALIERQLRTAMRASGITTLPLYPEDRDCTAPSATRTLEIFDSITRHHLHEREGHRIQTFELDLTPLQRQVLDLLDIDPAVYTQPS